MYFCDKLVKLSMYIYTPRLFAFMKHIFISLLLFLFSNVAYSQRITRVQYIDMYKDIAVRQMNLYGIPASIIMAQACLESNNGNSELARNANNHFGIKGHNGWNGRVYLHDDEKKNEKFRAYKTAEESFKDHSEFLKSGKRYAFLFSYDKTDYVSWAHGLKQAGYATNPKYAQLLIKVIEDNGLYRLDLVRGTEGKESREGREWIGGNGSANVSKALTKIEKREQKRRLKEQKRQDKLKRKMQRKSVNKGRNSIY